MSFLSAFDSDVEINFQPALLYSSLLPPPSNQTISVLLGPFKEGSRVKFENKMYVGKGAEN